MAKRSSHFRTASPRIPRATRCRLPRRVALSGWQHRAARARYRSARMRRTRSSSRTARLAVHCGWWPARPLGPQGSLLHQRHLLDGARSRRRRSMPAPGSAWFRRAPVERGRAAAGGLAAGLNRLRSRLGPVLELSSPRRSVVVAGDHPGEKRHGEGSSRGRGARSVPPPDRPVRSAELRRHLRELAESELFGHERGSFTGAITTRRARSPRRRRNAFPRRDRDLPTPLQVKLLRALEAGE